MEAISAAPNRPSAVICVNDQIAFAVLRALAERHVEVPRDISVVGYDDVDFAAWLSPTLTSIRQPKYELGRAAARLLLAEASGPLLRHDAVRFEPELVERESTTLVARSIAEGARTAQGGRRPRSSELVEATVSGSVTPRPTR